MSWLTAIHFQMGYQGSMDMNDHFVVVRPDSGSLIALEDASVVKNPTHPAGSVEIGLEVENIETVFQDWKAKGVEIVDEISPMPRGQTFLARDPEGHYIAIYSMNRR